MNEKYKTKDGEMRDSTCFVDCVLWGKGAEVFAKYTSKGTQVHVDGSLTLEQWESKEGKRSKHVVKVRDFTFLGPRPPDDRGTPPMKGRLAGRTTPAPLVAQKPADGDFPLDDIPF